MPGARRTKRRKEFFFILIAKAFIEPPVQPVVFVDTKNEDTALVSSLYTLPSIGLSIALFWCLDGCFPMHLEHLGKD